MFRRHFLSALGAVPILSFTACRTRNQDKYPSREIRLIVQAAPGGLSDAVSRVIASQLEPILGVPVVCQNRPGASGALAFAYVVRQKPDGYTLGHAPVEIAMVRLLGLGNVGPEQMDLICMVSRTKPVLAVHIDAPWQNIDSFLQEVRAQPGHYVIGNSGTGSIWHVNALLLERRYGLQFVHLPFPGSARSIAALLGRHIDAVVAGEGEVVSHVQAGRLRVLLVLSGKRSGLYPEVPCTAELGQTIGVDAWSGFYGPKGMPEEVHAVLQLAFRQAFESDAFQKLCQQRGMEPVFLPRPEFESFAREQLQFFATELPKLLHLQS